MAADTYSAILGWLNQGTGNNNNSWGDNCDNSIFPIFEKAIAGLSSHAVTGGTLNLTSDAPPSGPTAALEMVQAFTGTLASDQVVQVPNLSKLWLVYNGTDGAKTLKFKTTDGDASAAIPQGGFCFVWCDGGDNIYVGLSSTLRDTQWLGADGTLAAPGLSFASEPTAGIRRDSAGVFTFVIDGADILTWSDQGINVATDLALTVGGVSVVPPGAEMNYTGITEPSGWYFEDGSAKLRTTDAALMAAITKGFTSDTNTTVTLSNVSVDLRGLGLEGSVLEGTGIPTAATIVSIDSATQITISAAATNTATAGAMRAFPYGNGDGSTTFDLPEANGTVAVARDNMGGTAANRVTNTGSGVKADRLCTIGGVQTVTVEQDNLPNVNFTVSIPSGQGSHSHSTPYVTSTQGVAGGSGNWSYAGGSTTTNAATLPAMSGTAASGGSGTAMTNVQPSRIRNVIIKR